MRLGQYVSGFLASGVALLAGGWLMLAPWWLGYPRPAAGGWGAAVLTGFWTGLGVIVVAGAAVAVYAGSLAEALRRAGVIASRPRRALTDDGVASVGDGQAFSAARAQPEPAVPDGVRGPASVANLDELLVPVATALLRDLARRQTTGGGAAEQPEDGSEGR